MRARISELGAAAGGRQPVKFQVPPDGSRTFYNLARAAGREGRFAVITRLVKVVAAVALLLVFSMELLIPARSQVVRIGGGRGRRVGRVVLPTPPFNPDAGILDSPRGRGRNSPKVTPRRTLTRRRRGARRGWQGRRGVRNPRHQKRMI